MSRAVATRRSFVSSLFSLLSINLIWLAPLLFAPATSAAAQTDTFTVMVTSDPVTGTAANCPKNNAGGSANCSLRDAITAAIADTGETAVVVDMTNIGGVITLGSGLPEVSMGVPTATIAFNGPGVNALTVSGNNAYQPFCILTAGGVTFQNFTVTNGYVSATGGFSSDMGYGGGIYVLVVPLTMNNMVVTNNYAANGAGGVLAAGSVTMTQTTISNNSVNYANGATAGGLYAIGSPETIYQSTFSGNSAWLGAAIETYNPVTLTISDSTFVNNSNLTNTTASTGGSGTILNENGSTLTIHDSTFWNNVATYTGGVGTSINNSGTLTVTDTIMAASGDTTGAAECYTSAGGCPTNGDANGNLIVPTGLNLSPLGYYGGPTETVLPLSGSTAICGGKTGAGLDADASGNPLTVDQRGLPLDASCAAGSTDAGAVQINALTVNSSADTGGSTCGGTCTLRQAINQANASGGDITIDSSLNGATLTLTSILPKIEGAINVSGPSGGFIIDGANKYQAFWVDGGASLSLSNITIQNATSGTSGSGAYDFGYGGAIFNTSNLTVSNCAFLNNTSGKATGQANPSEGGAILNTGSATISNCTFSGNTASDTSGYVSSGGAITTSGPLTITDSTFSTNSAPLGAAIYDLSSNPISVNYSTFAGNAAVETGALDLSGGTAVIAINDTFANNTGASSPGAATGINNDGGTLTVKNSLLAETTECNDPACSAGGAGDVSLSTPGVSALGNHGGTTQTVLPLPGSAAICGGVAGNIPSGVTTDQRGFPNAPGNYGVAGCSDAGSVQTDYTAVAFTNPGPFTGSEGIAGTNPPIVVTVTESGNNVGDVPVTVDVTGIAGSTISGNTSTTVAGTGATFNNLEVAGATGSGDVAVSMLVVGADTLTAGPETLNINPAGTTADTVTEATPSPAVFVVSATATPVTLSATVKHGTPAVTEGNVTFTVCTTNTNPCGGTIIGTVIPQVPLNGSGSTGNQTYTIPANQAAGTYYAIASYNDPGGTYESNIASQTITINNALAAATAVPSTTLTDHVAATPFTPVTASGGVPPYTYSIVSPSPALPAGLSIDSSTGQISGTPTVTAALATYTVTVTDSATKTATATFQLTVNAPTITITPNPLTAITVGVAMTTQTLTGAGGVSPYTFAVTSGSLPAGISLDGTTGALTGTATQGGSVGPFTVTATDHNGNTGTGTYTWTVNPPTIGINPGAETLNATKNVAFTQTFTVTGTGTSPFTWTETGALPAGITFTPAAAPGTTATLAGTPTVTGSFPITIKVTDSSTGSGPYNSGSIAYTLVVAAPTITITPSPALPAATVGTAFSQQLTAAGGTSPYTYAETGALPAGVTLSTAGLLSGTPTAGGSFPITVTATDHNGNTGTISYTWTVNAPTIGINPGAETLNATTHVAFSQTFTVTGTGTSPFTWTETGALPAGITFTPAAAPGTTATLAGTTTATGSFPITIKVTDSSTGSGPYNSGSIAYTLVVAAPTITITPSPALPAATVGTAFSQQLSSAGGTSPYTYAETGALPAGVTLSTAGLLSGTPTAGGSFPITVTATDHNGNTGTISYTWTVNAPTIGINPGAETLNATTHVAFSQTFTVTGTGTSPFTWTETGALPAGITFTPAAAPGTTATLAGTTTATGSFPITIKVTDSSTGSGPYNSGAIAYTLTVTAPTIAITPSPALPAATVGVAYNQTITSTGGTGPYTYTETGALPAGVTLTTAGVLSGTPTAGGSFPITITATDSNGNTGTQAETWTVNAPTITILPAAGNLNATAEAAFTQTFTVTGGTPSYTWTETGALPAGITWSAASATLSGTATASGSFPITIKVTDNSTGSGPYSMTNAYTLVVAGPTITMTPAAGALTGTVGAVFTQAFTASGGVGPYTYSETGALPAGVSFSGNTLSGTPTQGGTFAGIMITAKDANNFTYSQTYTLTVNAPTITLAPPAGNLTVTAEAAFSQAFTASGGTSPYTYSETGALPTGLSWTAGTGTISGTATQSGSFPITITAHDSSTGTGAPYSTGAVAYTLVVSGPTINVTPATLPGATAAVPYSQQMSATGGTGTFTWSETGTLPAGITFSATGLLSGTATQAGSFPLTITAKDGDNFTGTASVTLTVAGPTLAISPTTLPPASTTAAYSQAFTASGGTGPYTYAETGALPAGITWTAATATLSGTPTVSGTFPITITVTDSTTGTGAPFSKQFGFTLAVNAPTITIAPTSLPAASIAAAYNQTVTASGGSAPYTYTVTAGALPAGLTLSSAGAISGTPTAGGTFTFTITAKDSSSFTGTGNFTLTVNAPTLTLTPPTGNLGVTAGTAFSQTFTATGGTGPYTYTETGTLPTGLTFSAGTLSGTTTQSGSFPISVTAKDSSTGAGPYSVSVNYTIVVGTNVVTITWPNPSAITYGTSLAGVLDATATNGGNTVAGTFVYTATPTGGSASTVTSATDLAAGTYTLTATFTPTNTATYTAPSPKSVSLTVNQAQPTISWTPAATIAYGTTLAGELNAAANFGGNSVAGSFAYTATPSGGSASAVTSSTVLADGSYTLGVTFTPTDTTDYKTATATAPLTVTSQMLTVSANNATKVYGAANPTFSGSITGQQNGDTFTESFTTTATTSSIVGTYGIVPSVTGANLSDYTVVINDGTLTITQAASTTTLTANSTSVNPGATVTLTATVADGSSGSTGTPTGTVTFYNGSTMLGTGTLTGGVATYSTTTLAAGSTDTLTAVYSGDANFTASSTTQSITITVAPLGLTLTATPGSQTGNPGTTFTYQLAVAPTFGAYPGTVSFAAAGGPAGSVITFTPSTLAANAGSATVSMSVATSASASVVQPDFTGRKLAPFAFALLLLPLAGTRRMRRSGRWLGRFVCLFLLALGGIAATTALTGCGSSPGGSTKVQQGTQYTIVVTAGSGNVQQSTSVTLTLQ